MPRPQPGVFPILAALVIPAVYPAFFKTAVRLHLEAEAMLQGNTTISLKKKGAKGDNPNADADAGEVAADEAMAAMAAC